MQANLSLRHDGLDVQDQREGLPHARDSLHPADKRNEVRRLSLIRGPGGPATIFPNVVALRGKMQHPPAMQKGTVKFFNATKGFGFITPEGGGKDVFVHANDTGGALLQEGTKVEFEVVQGKKGPQASGVKVI